MLLLLHHPPSLSPDWLELSHVTSVAVKLHRLLIDHECDGSHGQEPGLERWSGGGGEGSGVCGSDMRPSGNQDRGQTLLLRDGRAQEADVRPAWTEWSILTLYNLCQRSEVKAAHVWVCLRADQLDGGGAVGVCESV